MILKKVSIGSTNAHGHPGILCILVSTMAALFFTACAAPRPQGARSKDAMAGLTGIEVPQQREAASPSPLTDQAQPVRESAPRPSETIMPDKPVAASNSFMSRRSTALEWVEKSNRAARQKDWTEAIRTSSVALTIDPHNADAYVNRAWAYCEKGLYEDALTDSNRAIELDPKNAAALNNRGLTYQKMKQRDKAIQDYRSACELGLDVSCQNFKELVGCLPSEEISFYQKQGIEAFSAGDYDRVILITGKVIEIDPGNAEAYSTRCGAKANKGLLEEAEQDCRKSIEFNPNFSMAYNNLGYVMEREGMKKEAIVYYEMSCGMGNKLGCQNQQRLSAPAKP